MLGLLKGMGKAYKEAQKQKKQTSFISLKEQTNIVVMSQIPILLN